MKICDDCKYVTSLGLCIAPENGLSPVTGTPMARFALMNRSDKGSILHPGELVCGPDAIFFVPKEKPLSLWGSWFKR